MLDFSEVKKVRIVDIAAKYGIRLRFKGEWASAPCPLPTHKVGDKGKNFTINLAQNYWRCWSDSCNQNNGGKRGGDNINFVALMEKCRERDAAQKIAGWYGLSGNKNPAQRMAERGVREEVGCEIPPPKDSQNNTSAAVAVKGNGFLHETGVWLDEVLVAITDEGVRKTVKKLIVSKIFESYKNGKACRT